MDEVERDEEENPEERQEREEVDEYFLLQRNSLSLIEINPMDGW